MIECIIWDWNGTLLDDTWIGHQYICEFLKNHQREPISLDEYRALFEFPVQNFYARLGFVFKTPTDWDAVQKHFHHEFNRRTYESRLQAGALEALTFFERRGVTQSILSTLSQDLLDQHTDHFGVRKYFSRISGSTSIQANGKLDRAAKLLGELKALPNRTLLIGDTQHDAEVARHLGSNCLLLASGCNSQERLSSCGYPVAYNLHQALEEGFGISEKAEMLVHQG